MEPTGVINSTLLVASIPLADAQKLVPNGNSILTKAYQSLLPDFPKDQYPVLLQAALDHDIRVGAQTGLVDDFQRIGFQLPFIDLLGDGSTSFCYVPSQMMTSSNTIAIAGGQAYGITVYPSDFNPSCDAYAYAYAFASSSAGSGCVSDAKATIFAAKSNDENGIFANLTMRPVDSSRYPLSFFANVTNQPMFGDGKTCDKQLRYFNTSLTQGEFAPKSVKAYVSTNLHPIGGGKELAEMYGYQVASAFAEYNGLDCKSLKGYPGS